MRPHGGRVDLADIYNRARHIRVGQSRLTPQTLALSAQLSADIRKIHTRAGRFAPLHRPGGWLQFGIEIADHRGAGTRRTNDRVRLSISLIPFRAQEPR